MKIYNCVMGEISSRPFAPPDKFSWYDVGAAAVSAGGNVLSNILGASAQRDANRTNLQIARENNAQAYKIFQEQNQFNLDMWNKQNAYNLPTEQVKRLLDAGINPSAVFGAGSTSEAGSLTSAPAPSLQQAHVEPFRPDIDTSGAVNAFMQSQMQNEQRKLMATQRDNVAAQTAHTQQLTDWEQKSQFARLSFLEKQAKKEGVLGDIAREQLQFETESYWHRLKMIRQDVRSNDLSYEMTQQQIYGQKLQNGLYELQLIYQPKMNEAELRQYRAVIGQIRSVIELNEANASLSRQEKLTEIKRRTGVILDNTGKLLDNNLKRSVFKFAVQDAENRTAMLDFERRNQKSGERLRRFASVVPFASGFQPKKLW